MTWTYIPDYSLQRDRVRDLIGDTDSGDQLLTDEQIGKYTTGGQLAQGNDYLAAAACAGDIATKFARRVSMSAGGTSVQLNQQAEAYRAMVKDLRAKALRLGGAAGYAGGISISDKSVQQDDTDAVIPAFTRQMGDTWNRELQPMSRDLDGWAG